MWEGIADCSADLGRVVNQQTLSLLEWYSQALGRFFFAGFGWKTENFNSCWMMCPSENPLEDETPSVGQSSGSGTLRHYYYYRLG